MSDTLVYDMASSSEGEANIFVRKEVLNILDNQNGNYRGNQSVIDSSQLANSNRYMNYREAYLAIPLTMCMSSTASMAPATAATSVDYALGLKNWFGSIVHSLTVEIGGSTIVQQTPLIGLWNTFKLMTSLSLNDVKTQGASIGFYPDHSLSVSFADASNNDGFGICNNQNFMGFTVVNGALNSYDVGNEGLLRRQQYINYDPDGLTVPTGAAYSSLFSANACNSVYKSYISDKNNTNRAITYSIMATVYLKHLHSFFQNVPLLKGVFMKLTLNLNQSSFTTTASANNLGLPSVVSPLGGVSPLMLASARASNGSATLLAAQTLTASIQVGTDILNSTNAALCAKGVFTNSISLYVPSYTFNPVFEQAYISQPVKRIVYTDIYQYQISNIASGQTFNQLITNGIAGLKSVLVLPYYTTAANSGINPLLSPYAPDGAGPTSPLCLLNNYQVVVSGQNMLYNNQKYSFSAFLDNLIGANSINGGLTDGVTSGLISQLDFETEYCYHYVNCGRMLPIEESVPKSVSIQGQNQSAKAIDLIVFCEYGVEIRIDCISGNRV